MKWFGPPVPNLEVPTPQTQIILQLKVRLQVLEIIAAFRDKVVEKSINFWRDIIFFFT